MLSHRKWRYWKQDQRPDTTPRPSGETADQKPPEGALLPKIHLLLLTRKSPPTTGYTAYFLFESFFPFVLSFAALSQVSVGADFWGHKDSFYSSHLKNNFRCHLFSLPFWGGRWFSPQPGFDGPSLLKRSRPAAYKCLKKEPSSPRSKTTSKLGRLKGRTQ